VRGQEWFPVEIPALFLSLIPAWTVFGVLLLAYIVRVVNRKNIFNQAENIPFGLLLLATSSAFFVMTLLSRRYIEFFSPIFILTVAWWCTEYFNLQPNFAEHLKQSFKRFRVWFIVLAFSLVLILVPVFLRLDSALRDAIPFTHYKTVSQWLSTNQDEKTLVFNVSWSDYPSLFYHNSNTQFVLGLDPRLAINPNHTQSWYSIFAMQSDDPQNVIVDVFGADIVLVSASSKDQLEYLEKNGFIVIYKDDEAVVLSLNQ
jgi:hypothetical protein